METDTHKLLTLLDNKFPHEPNERLIERIKRNMRTLQDERDGALQLRDAYNSNVKDWRELCGYLNLPLSELSKVISVIGTIRKERDELRDTVKILQFPTAQLPEIKERDDVLTCSDAAQILKRCKQASEKHKKFPHDEKDVAGITLDDIPKLVAYSFQARNEIVGLRKERDDAMRALRVKTEQRYVIHGDIKPCTVLYSDDTTTLLRLETQDMMCETDTIEWSDELTYRCQELLRGTGFVLDSVMLKYSNRVAQLVRDGALQFGKEC